MAWKSWMLSAAVFCTALAACGDDDAGTTAPTDMGGRADLNVQPDLGQPTDGGVDAATPAGSCDPYAADSCPTTEKCSVVLRNAGLPSVTITFECMPRTGTLTEGQVCPGLSTEVPGSRRGDGGTVVNVYDVCEQGTFCWDTPPIPGYPPQPRSCRPLCGSTGVFCEENEFCSLLNDDEPTTAVIEPRFGVCKPGGCDPVLQTGCTLAQDACYIVYSTRSEILGACLEVNRDADAGTPFAPGTPCQFATQCAPGSGCLPAIVAGVFAEGASTCREYCAVGGIGGGFGGGPSADGGIDAGDVDGGEVDAGTPATDAGVDAGTRIVDAGTDSGPPRTGACPPSLGCVAFPLGDPDAGMPIRTPTDPGLCQ